MKIMVWLNKKLNLRSSPHEEILPVRRAGRVMHDCSDCFRLEQNCRVVFSLTGKRRLGMAHTHLGPSFAPLL